MCNLVAVKTHTHPGDVVLADHMAHIIRAESGGAAFVSRVLIEPIASDRGIFTPDTLNEALERVKTAPFPYAPLPRLLCVEQTHNFGGGTVWALDELARLDFDNDAEVRLIKAIRRSDYRADPPLIRFSNL